jgi:hypothetical protein
LSRELRVLCGSRRLSRQGRRDREGIAIQNQMVAPISFPRL